MKHIELVNRFRTDLSRLVVEVEASVAMNQLDINKICEDVVCGLFREIYGFEALRNLNSEERENYPGIDLADDEARVAIQVTSDRSLDKVKETLGKVIKHGLTDKYDRIIIYNLTRKQRSYSKSAISAVCGDKISFDASSDILDFKDISEKAGTLTPTKLQAASDHLFSYMHGSGTRTSGNQGDIDKLTVNTPDPALADEKILYQLQLLRVSRQFAEFDRLGEARRLAESCTSGQLSSGSSSLRSRALAWCSRILSNDDSAEAERVLNAARALSREPEIDIAEAFLISKLDGRNPALSALASKNTPQAASAALFIVSNRDGKAQALEWFRKTGISPSELDADGKNLLLDLQLEQRDWSGAAVTVGFCSDADCEETPILRLNLAFESLLKIVPEEYRPLVHAQVPFERAAFFLASGEEALRFHRDAQSKFKLATERFQQLGMPKAAELSEGYDLWLALSHPDLKNDAQDRLRAMLRDPARSLRLVPLALNFGVGLDLDTVARALDRQVALFGGPTSDTAVARLSLALTQPSEEKVAAYIERYRGELEPCLDVRAIAFIEIEMLSRSGQADAAQQAFERLKAAVQLSPDEEARLKIILSEASNDAPTAARRVQYEKTKSLTDLKNLVDTLYDKEEWSHLTEYAAKLHEATKSVLSAEQLVASLVKSGQDHKATDFIEANESLLEQSPKLRTLKCWALYRSGRLLEAREALALISVDKDAKNYHVLRRNIAMASGDWQGLAQIVGDEAMHIEERSAEEIIQAAYLGFQVRSPAAAGLLFAAAQKGADNPQILASAYFLATNAGIEDDPVIAGWLHRAAELSGEDGPIQSASLQDILEMQPEWNDRQERTLRMLRNAEVPMFMAAQSLNRSLIEMILAPLLANLQEDDPRRRIPVYAFSGKRVPSSLPFPDVIGLDASALLTLGGLELLNVLKSAPFKIRIPHSTLQWLFGERQRAAFHQPSRFQRAQKLQDMIAAGRVKILTPGPMTDSRLSAEVGEELAAMIGESKEVSSEGRSNAKYVVRSSPVRRVGSLMNEDADLSSHQAIIVSCQGVVEKLRAMGRLTVAETRRAHAFLQLNEQRWLGEPNIEDGSILFLDSLSVSYFQTCKLLEKIADAGFNILISKPFSEENRSLLSLQRMSDELECLIEDIRAFLQDGIQSGAIVVDPLRHKDDEQDEHDLRGHPTAEALLFSEECDLVVFDDRSINQHPNVGLPGGATRPILTSLELLALCTAEGYLDAERSQEAMTKLRRGGFLFLEIDEEELFAEISECKSGDDGLRETAELRAIRESFTFSRLVRVLRHEDETPWLDRSIITILKVYRRVWSSGDCLSNVTARAAWLMELGDIRGWLVSFPYAQARHILQEGRIHHLMVQIAPPVDVEQERQKAFLKWIDEHLVIPLRREYPALFERLVQVEKSMLLSYLDRNLLSRESDDDQ
ncbi:MAG TPA: HNH endonuclease [Rhodobacter sp.]|nr:HNH endonuclease [Rhodobacter sp.]